MQQTAWIPAEIAQASDHVEGRLDRPWSLNAFAAVASFSPFHFHRKFQAAMGETPSAFVERIRLERAAFRLLTCAEPITELALGLGFRNPETFARRFRKRFGVPAREYRRHQLELWSRLGLEAGKDPLPGRGTIRLERRTVGWVECRRSIGEDEGFDFDPNLPIWRELAEDAVGVGSVGITLDAPGITEPGRVRQDWGRRIPIRRVRAGRHLTYIRRRLYAVLDTEGIGPVDNTAYQRLYVWAMAGRYRADAGPIVEIFESGRIGVHQPVIDTQEGWNDVQG